MLKKVLLCSLSTLFLVSVCAWQSFASNPGAADLLLTSSDSTKKPAAVFPHKKHQDAFKCGECHHGMQDGKQVAYSEGMEITKCETCHNAEKFGDNKDLNSFKGVGHANCLECHKEVAKKDDSKKELKSCNTCHKK